MITALPCIQHLRTKAWVCVSYSTKIFVLLKYIFIDRYVVFVILASVENKSLVFSAGWAETIKC